MVKVLPFRLQQCFCPFTMLLGEVSSETRLFRHLSNHVFGFFKFKNTSTKRVIFFFKLFTMESKFRK